MAKLDATKVEKFKKGELKLAEALNLNPKQVAAMLLVGQSLYAQGRLREAKNIFAGLAALDGKNPYVQTVLGLISQKQENYDEAVSRYTRALNLYPEDILALKNRGEVYLKLGRFAEAAEDLKKAIALDPEGKNPAANRARLLVMVTREALNIASEEGIERLLETKGQIDQKAVAPAEARKGSSGTTRRS